MTSLSAVPGGGPGADLERFVQAQDAGGAFDRALRELASGRKVSHWMWFVFPQVQGLGASEMSRRYAISGLAEARAYLAHPVLGPRLERCARVLLGLGAVDAELLLGATDALKLRSSMTLFALAAGGPSPYGDVLGRYFDGHPDELTARLLTASGPSPGPLSVGRNGD